ncbi:hypothetical protein BMF94_4223 [Rhodotorula taiwanensis]|uniref:Uncharacterized protein n=1 Tax=Rhodotorula taiwanensis TaxID=741276 RepID=A0A2S5B7Q4_9BASI|nr:hypothetical protein BMF94_4223 [Rhodotorula taiwanensis]
MSVTSTVGPVLLGSCFSCLTCGVLLSLTARYWAIFSRDEWYVRLAVATGSVYALVDTALNCSWAYRWAVTDYVLPDRLAILPWQLAVYCFSLGVTAFLVQSFYITRLFRLSRRNYLLCGPLAFVIAGCLALSVYMGYYCSSHKDSLPAFDELSHFVTPWMAGALAIDLATFDWSQVPRKIMQTNAPSTLFQLALVILHALYPKSLRFIVIGFCSSKFYLGTFIATCNARDPHGSLSFDETLDTRRLKGLGSSPLPPVHVNVERERRVDGDDLSLATFDTAHGDNSTELATVRPGVGIAGGPKPSLYYPKQFRVDFDNAAAQRPEADKL